jgi:predicted RNA-binding Zn-ribbon protein involved in translation (DUF1610 family)
MTEYTKCPECGSTNIDRASVDEGWFWWCNDCDWEKEGWVLADQGPVPNRVECAWCGTEMSPGADPVSHSICPECDAKID